MCSPTYRSHAIMTLSSSYFVLQMQYNLSSTTGSSSGSSCAFFSPALSVSCVPGITEVDRDLELAPPATAETARFAVDTAPWGAPEGCGEVFLAFPPIVGTAKVAFEVDGTGVLLPSFVEAFPPLGAALGAFGLAADCFFVVDWRRTASARASLFKLPKIP